MQKEIRITVDPRTASEDNRLRLIVADELGVAAGRINEIKITRRSIDARQAKVKINLSLAVALDDTRRVTTSYKIPQYKDCSGSEKKIIIVGAGPAGLFAGLRALELGMRPIVLERGKDVDERRLDLVALNRDGKVNPDSNYCFGEGGAGTFSDGKLYTRSHKRGNIESVLNALVFHGASEEILVDAHPHIGSDRLPHIIKAIRNTIISHGGEVHFNTRVEGLIIEDGKAVGAITDKGEVRGDCVILATGHSARDVYHNLRDAGIKLEAKGFAMGVRLEHPQQLIDRIQYHSPQGRGKWLPAAEYSFVTQVDGRGVYSFCMCPGGVVVPSASGPQQSVVNGMSASARSSRLANSGMVVEIRPGDFPEYEKYGDFELLRLQEDLEKRFYDSAGQSVKAPAQRMTDFVEGRKSKTLPPTSYLPAVVNARVDEILPPFISERLKKGFAQFGRRSKGFLTPEAMVLGLESRTSSPVRIPRDKESREHVEIGNLYPVGEGAGYAGGIVSAALDGILSVDSYNKKVN